MASGSARGARVDPRVVGLEDAEHVCEQEWVGDGWLQSGLHSESASALNRGMEALVGCRVGGRRRVGVAPCVVRSNLRHSIGRQRSMP